MKFRFLICLLSLCFFFCVACDKEFHKNGIEETSGMINVEFSLDLSDAFPEEIGTRSRAFDDDTYIGTVDVLVFDETRRFKESIRLRDTDLVRHPNGVSFSLRLEATPDRRIIHVITNGFRINSDVDRLPFSSLRAGMHEDECMNVLKTIDFVDAPLKENITPVIMWGRTELNGVSIMTKVEGLKLLRTTACLQIKKGNESGSNGLPDFEIQGMTVYKYAGSAYISPTDYLSGGEIPLIPNPSVAPYIEDYTKAWNMGSAPSLYVYERTCSESDYMGVLLKASYKGQVGYYKIVMTDVNKVPLSVIRNHRYIILIRSVNAPGYTNIETAINSAPSNALQIEVVNDDTEYPFIVADGQHQMALSNNYMTLSGSASEVILANVYSSRGVRPNIYCPADWLSCSVLDLGNNKYQIRGVFSNTSFRVEAIVNIKCDNLVQDLSVAWNPVISTISDADSYVADLVDVYSCNWNVSLNSSDNWIWLHPQLSTPSSFDGIMPSEGMIRSLNSVVASKAYLHVGKGRDRIASLIKSEIRDGKSICERLVIAQ
ncbi:MAG: FimB/Mfa2 family fimbrial subunit [Bacteroidales bacterium]